MKYCREFNCLLSHEGCKKKNKIGDRPRFTFFKNVKRGLSPILSGSSLPTPFANK